MIFRMLPTSLKEQIAIEPDDISKVFKTVDSSRRQCGELEKLTAEYRRFSERRVVSKR